MNHFVDGWNIANPLVLTVEADTPDECLNLLNSLELSCDDHNDLERSDNHVDLELSYYDVEENG